MFLATALVVSIAFPVATRAVTVADKTATLRLSAGVTSNDAVVVSYAVPALDALHDAAGNAVAPFTSKYWVAAGALCAGADRGGCGLRS